MLRSLSLPAPRASQTCLLLACLLLASCTPKRPAVGPEEVRAVLKDHPELVLEVLAAHSGAVFDISQSGFEEKQRQAKVAAWKAQLASPRVPALSPDMAVRGQTQAPVTVVAYIDLLNPVYAQNAPVLKALLDSRPGQVRVLVKHLPLGFEDLSRPAAALFEALYASKPEAAWAFHDQVLARQREFLAVTNPAPARDREAALAALAAALGADPAVLDAARGSAGLTRRLDEDRAEARRFGFTASPVYLIHGVILNGQPPLEDFLQVMGLLPGPRPNS